ncbi:MAG: ion channel [Solirubrobacteraceae bacterium]
MAKVLDVATDRYGIVLILIVITYVLVSALPSGDWSQVLLTAVQGATVVAALAASEVPVRRRRRAAWLATAAVLIAMISALVGGRLVGLASFISAILLAAALVATIIRIASHSHVSAQTLLGAVCAYVLFGLIYAFVYSGVARLSGGHFLSPPGTHTLSDYVFFSFTTLTTTGYGNLIPITGLGRALAMLEALMGQLYLVTVLARLVALWTPQRRVGRRPDDGA